MIDNLMLSVMAWAETLIHTIKEDVRSDGGQGILEYVVLVGFIGIVAYVAFATIGFRFTIGDFASKLQACLSFDDAGCGV